MSDVVSVLRRVTSVDVAPQYDNYSKVIVHVSKDTTYEVGDDTGRTLEITNPFGTQEMAQNILSSLTGYQYQPYYADGALLDPSAEIGDAVNVRGAYGGIYTRKRSFGRLMTADISAPHDEEINHEYQFESPEQREFTRQINDVKASLIIANESIDASVTKTGGSNTSGSFSWSLTANGHRWYANGAASPVFEITKDGAYINGEVRATKGYIGNFVIGATNINNNMPSMSATQSNGVYLGSDGIKLGQAFKVTSSGAVTATNITANNMVLTGTLRIGGTNITAEALRSGAQSAYSNGSRWSTGSGYGYNYNNATKKSGGSYPGFFRATVLYCSQITASSFIDRNGILHNTNWRYMKGADGNYYYFLTG